MCCQCSDLLGRLFSRPLLRVQEANPLLYTYVQDLVTVEVRGHHCIVCMSGMMKVFSRSAGSPTEHTTHEAVLCAVQGSLRGTSPAEGTHLLYILPPSPPLTSFPLPPLLLAGSIPPFQGGILLVFSVGTGSPPHWQVATRTARDS